MKKRIVSLLLTLLTILSLLPTAVMAAESTGVGITPVTDPNLWTTRLNSQGQSYSYRPPTAAGRQLYCMDLGYSYRYGTESFLQSYTYRSATGADADALWNDAVAETGLVEMDANGMDDELHRRLHRRDPRLPVHGAPDLHLGQPER